MNIFNKFKQTYLSSDGRVSRKFYFLHLFLLFALVYFCCVPAYILFFKSIESLLLWILDEGVVIAIIFVIFVKILFLNLTAKRWHDINQSGWTSVVLFTPLSGLAFLALIFLPGSSIENKFGCPPYILSNKT